MPAFPAILSLLLALGPAFAAPGRDSAKEPAAVRQTWKLDPAALAPFWRSDLMVEEPILFVQGAEPEPSGRLLFPATRIVAVQSADGKVTYEAGRDYTWEPGTDRITLPSGSRIACPAEADLRRAPGTQQFALTHRDGGGEIMFGPTHEYHDLQTVVTYRHRRVPWRGPKHQSARKSLPGTAARLAAGRPLTIAVFGDSISTGCNASGWAGAPPWQPAWQDLLALELERAYGSRILLRNFAVGGTDTAWGVASVGPTAAERADLVVLAFGMNDCAGRPPEEFAANMRAMVEAVRAARADTEVVLVAGMMGHSDWTALRTELLPQYRDAMKRMCGPGVALADLTGVWQEMLTRKQHRDLTGNGVNHPNDFGHRVYAQALLALLAP